MTTRRKLPSFALLFFLFLAASLVLSATQKKETFLQVEASIRPRWLSRGQEGKVVIKIRLEEGVRINAQPSFIIECLPSRELLFPKNFFTASDLEIAIEEEDGREFLVLKNPIEIPFTVSLEAERGNHTFRGKIKYFAFSPQKRWCMKSSAKFSASFYTRSTTVKRDE